MARFDASNNNAPRTLIWIFVLAGTLSLVATTVGCGENTERVLARIPSSSNTANTGGFTTTTSGGVTASGGYTATGGVVTGGIAATGGMNSGGVDSTGRDSGGLTSGGIPSTGGATAGGGTSTLLIAKSAVGAPIGYAAVPGNNLLTTTGGGQLTPTYATSCSDLQTLLAMDDTPRVVVIDNRTIDCTNPMTVSACILPCDSSTGDTRNYYRVLTGADCSSSGGTATTTTTTKTQNSTTIFVQSNKTLLGTGTTSGISAADLYLQSTVSNVIIQNLSLTNVNPDLAQDGDAVTIDGAHHVWVDHCYFNLIGDGFVDAINSASNITLSWNHFDGRNPNACGYQHNYTHTIENATVTFHHNFYDHTLAFSPKVTLPAGKAHIFNNYWLNVLYYSIGVDKGAQALIERNDFDSSERPYWGLNGCLGKNNCAMGDSGGSNQFENIPPGSAQTKDTGGILTALPYQLTPSQIDDVSVVKAEVTQGAGPTLSP